MSVQSDLEAELRARIAELERQLLDRRESQAEPSLAPTAAQAESWRPELERRRAEEHQRLLTDVLRVLNRAGDLRSRLAEILALIRAAAGFDAVGLRLRVGDDFPYFEQSGFTPEFLRVENLLCARGGDGATMRDAQGACLLECTCGLVLSGRTEPSMSCFTEAGSFWTNVSRDLLALPRAQDPRTNPRNHCIHAGYQSVGLFPIRAGEEIVGLLQLNDRREGRFTPELVRFYEGLAQNLGLGLQRAAAEEALRRRETTLAQAGHMAHLGAWDIEVHDLDDLAANPLVWSDEVFRIFGYEPGAVAVTVESFFAHVHPADREAVAAAVARAVATRQPYSIEHRIVRRDGTERTVQEHAELVFDERGRLQRVIGAVQDVTERRRLEDALREADRRKDEFLGMLSHELRNPLMPIRNSLFVLEHTPPGGDQARRAQAIVGRQVEHLARLVDDLLDVTRIGRGKIQLHRERLELNALVSRAVEDLRASFVDRSIELTLQPAGTPMFVDGDPTRLVQATGNLLQNALKFTAPGGRTHVLVGRDDARGQAFVAVRDTGAGVAPELLPRLFEPFMQAEHTLDRSNGGLGLGLALVKGLIELHGGGVSAHSDGPGRGAEFTIRLPLGADEPRAPRAHPPAARPDARRLDVLVIEDNPDGAASLREAVELLGHTVRTAHDGRAGLAAARQRAPDVVLCDIGLPEMDGYAVARELRADAALPAVVLVALTGYAQPEDVARARGAGFDQHLAKPPRLDELRDLLTRAAG